MTNVGDSEISQLAQSAEYNERIERLGLSGQKKYTNANNCDVFPFKVGTQEQLFVFNEIFSTKSTIEDFDGELIPLEILEVYEKAKAFGRFKTVQVWSTPLAIVKDPILVAIEEKKYQPDWAKNDPRYKDYLTTDTYYYFLARWGEELLSFAELKAIAVKKWIDREMADLNKRLLSAEIAKKHINSFCGDLADVDLELLQKIPDLR